MKRTKYIINTLLMFSSCANASGEAISPGDEACFQITPAPEARVVVSSIKTEQVPKAEDEKAFVGFEKVYRDFIKAHDKRGMVIGRGNVQGIAEERITIPELKKLSWLFVDPGDAGGVGYLHDNALDTTQGNALATTWPVDFSIKDSFDAVVFDYGTLQYIGDDGTWRNTPAQQGYYNEKTKLKVKFDPKTMKNTVVNRDSVAFGYPTTRTLDTSSGEVSIDSFGSEPFLFNYWLEENNPPELLPLKEKYMSKIEEENKKIKEASVRQKEILKKGLKDAYLALKQGGVLIVPIDVSIDGVDFVELLSISTEDLVRHSIESIRGTITESPVLPQLRKGMGTFYGDYYSIVRK